MPGLNYIPTQFVLISGWVVKVSRYQRSRGMCGALLTTDIKLMSHILKLCERLVESRLRREVTISKQQHGLMPRKSTTDVMFAL